VIHRRRAQGNGSGLNIVWRGLAINAIGKL
jgi:hypothetical protein